MRYLIALLIPPLGLLLVGKPFQAILNLLLCLTLYAIPICMIWSICVVASVGSERRNKALIAAVKASKGR